MTEVVRKMKQFRFLLMLTMLFVGLSNMRDTLTQGEWEFDPREMFEMIFLCFIRGIATEKGRHFVDNFLLENFNDIKDKKIN